MKKTILLFVFAALVLLGFILWIGTQLEGFGLKQLLPFIVVLICYGVFLYTGFRRISSLRRGEPGEDELSIKILVKSSAVSYFVSLFFLLAVLLFSNKISMNGQYLLGIGVLGMCIIFVLSWLYFNFRGLDND